MKKLVCLVLALTILCGITAALADPIQIDGTSKRNIKIHEAGLNTAPQEMVDNLISPTTGRKLTEISIPSGFTGAAATGKYQPIMAQISNESNGIGVRGGKLYAIAPINGSYADVVYMACQKKGGNQTRMTMIFSDTIPDYIGFIRSTRLTHCRIRQEWDCAFVTSGYADSDVPGEWSRLGVKNPASNQRTPDDPGIVYVGDYPKVWKQYVWRLYGIKDSNSELFQAANIAQYIIPKDHVPANHTFLFSDELPEGGDDGGFIYVTYGNKYEADCRLEYDPDLQAYIRYVYVKDSEDLPYRESLLINPEYKWATDADGNKVKKVAAERVEGEVITFNNVIIQSINMNWKNSLRPDPQLVGEGNADYFMGGKHYAGVWQRKDDNSRTVYYDENGEELKLQRGRTLIILIDYTEMIDDKKNTANVKYE